MTVRMRHKPNLLPRLEDCDHWRIYEPETLKGRWREEFSEYKELRLEIGCGKGMFTCEQARRDSGVMLIALERVADAMVVAMERARDEQVENVRFMDKDAEFLPEWFAPGEISRIYVNFPDPWRKVRQYKRRLLSPAFLQRYAAALPVGGQLWFKTDNKALFDWSMVSLRLCGWTVEPMPEGTPMTNFEEKYTEQGLPIYRVVATRPAVLPEKVPAVEEITAALEAEA